MGSKVTTRAKVSEGTEEETKGKIGIAPIIGYSSVGFANKDNSLKATIPKEVSERLDLHPKDKVAWRTELTAEGNFYALFWKQKPVDIHP